MLSIHTQTEKSLLHLKKKNKTRIMNSWAAKGMGKLALTLINSSELVSFTDLHISSITQGLFIFVSGVRLINSKKTTSQKYKATNQHKTSNRKNKVKQSAQKDIFADFPHWKRRAWIFNPVAEGDQVNTLIYSNTLEEEKEFQFSLIIPFQTLKKTNEKKKRQTQDLGGMKAPKIWTSWSTAAWSLE